MNIEASIDPIVPTEVTKQVVTIGRYLLHRQIARGGMATIHIARLMGDEGFCRIVAAKRLLPEFAEDEEFVAMFLDEARIASKVHHRNVVPVLDVVTTGEEVVLVQEYVHGAPLHWLLKTARQAKAHVPLHIAVSIATQVLAGLHAAHETVDEIGAPLDIVHRDVSPQNVMVAIDGTARLLDFGVAKASMAAHVTRDGQFKGKLAYSAPEQLRGHATRQSDIYSLAVVLWELVVGHRMHQSSQGEAELVARVLEGALPRLTDALAEEREWIGDNRWQQLEEIERILDKGLAVDVSERWTSAAEMEEALVAAVPPASTGDVAAWLKALGKEFLDGRDRMLAAEEASWRRNGVPVPVRRLTPLPGTIRTLATRRIGTEEGTPSGAAQTMTPIPPIHRRSTTVIAILSTLVVALSIGIVFVMKGGHSSQAATQPTEAPANPPPPATIVPAAVTPPLPSYAPAITPRAPSPATEPEPPPEPSPEPPPAHEPTAIQLQPPVSRPPPVTVLRKPPVRQIARPPIRAVPPPAPHPVVAPRPAVAVPVVTPVQAPPAVTTDCNPPYYYEGQKKIFKPACL